MSPLPGQSYEYGACASFIPEFGVASGRSSVFRPPHYGGALPLQHCVPWSAKESGACNGTTTGGVFKANGGRYEPPCMNTLVTAASAANYPMDGDKKLVSAAAEVAPDTDTAPGPGVAPSRKENVATSRAAKIIVPVVHNNNRNGNSGGFNGLVGDKKLVGAAAGDAPDTVTARGPGVAPSGKEKVATSRAVKIVVPVVQNDNRKGNSGGFNGLVGDKKLVGAAAGDAPDTVTARGPGVAPSGKEKVATSRAVKIVVPVVQNDNRKGNSGGFNGLVGDKKLVGAAAGDAPDTVTARGPGVAPSGKEKVATSRAVKIVVPVVQNDNRKGNSGGLNGFGLFKGHKKLCWINKVDVTLEEYIMYMITPDGIASHKNKSVTKSGQLAQRLKDKGQKGANAYFAKLWKVLPDEEKAKYKHYALCVKLVLYKAKSYQLASLKLSSARTGAPTGERNLVGV